MNAETEHKGTRSASLYFELKWSGKSCTFTKIVELPLRLGNGYAGNIKGHSCECWGFWCDSCALTVGAGLILTLEYRLLADAGDSVAGTGMSEGVSDANMSDVNTDTMDAVNASVNESASEWIPTAASSTPVLAGTYEVRLAATESSFAFYPSTVVVDEYDPDAVTFSLVLDPEGGTWIEVFVVPNPDPEPSDPVGPDQSNPDPTPDSIPDPDTSDLYILSVSFIGIGNQDVSWDNQGRAQIKMPREKMPKKPEDFDIKVPDWDSNVVNALNLAGYDLAIVPKSAILLNGFIPICLTDTPTEKRTAGRPRKYAIKTDVKENK